MFCKRINKITAYLLVFVMAAMLICSGSAPVYALVGVDDAAFLYTLWSAFGLKAGVDITTIGGDAFTQDAISGLYNEWQNSRVASGVQAAVSTLADFVTNVLRVGTLVNPGSVASGTLYTVLSLSADVTEKLGQFWNWLIVDKLGGSSVDATDFQQGSGNLVVSASSSLPYITNANRDTIIAQGLLIGYVGTNAVYAATTDSTSLFYPFVTGDAALWFCSDYAYNYRVVVAVRGTSSVQGFSGPFTNANYPGVYYSGQNGLFTGIVPADGILTFSTLDDALFYFSGGVSSGALTVAPDAGVDVLGFPDTGAQDYVPADTNIAINIPYDSTADLTDYIAAGYDLALDNDLAVGVPEGVIEGTGTVGPVGDYVVPGLADVFPFCLPFDVYHFLEALAADPQAPHFTATLEFPEAVGGTQQIDIDFDNPTFNTLASILRTLELLAFCVGLAFVTRSFFIRG